MFARATSGDKRNNNKFSPCSLKAIEPVLNSKARSVKGCFTGEFLHINVQYFQLVNDYAILHQLNIESKVIFSLLIILCVQTLSQSN